MSDDPYVYPGTNVLRNRLGIRDARTLDFHEREIVTQRARQDVPTGNFDLRHLQAIHRHLFQDIYEWAGQSRTVEIGKGGQAFMFRQYIVTGMEDVHRRILAQGYLKGMTPNQFAGSAGQIIGDINHVHPFREGNGRTQLQYLKQLTERAGHEIDLTRLGGERWIEASKQANSAEYRLMSECVADALIERDRVRDGGRKSDEQRIQKLRDSIEQARVRRGDRSRDERDR